MFCNMESTQFEWDKDVAVRVRNVSKIYSMWRSPRARMMHPILGITRRVFPALHRRISVAHEGEGSLFKNFHALHDVSLDIRKGESWGFIGLNGSGKSTLLKIISGNLRPSTGYVLVDGKVAIIDYSSGISGEFTGRENIYSKAAIMGLSDKQIAEKVKSIEDFADIGSFIDQPAKTYSSGMGARLGFAIVAHMDSDILISDEALAVGDAFFVQKCMRFIHKFMEKGTFIFVSHSINDVMTLCDKAVWLQHGRVVAIGKAADVCGAYRSAIDKRSSVAFQELSQTAELPDDKTKNSTAHLRQSPGSFKLDAEILSRMRDYAQPEKSSLRISTLSSTAQLEERHFSASDILARSEGVGKSRIISVHILNNKCQQISECFGNEKVVLRVLVVAAEQINNAIVGFQFFNNRGLSLFAENSSCTENLGVLSLSAGDQATFDFSFFLPLLPLGDYTIRVGFADGTEDHNALLDVVNEAFLLRCITSGVRHGLVGVPLESIEATIRRNRNEGPMSPA
jgi:lipopolysaccharide transport system ATP-binding protein